MRIHRWILLQQMLLPQSFLGNTEKNQGFKAERHASLHLGGSGKPTDWTEIISSCKQSIFLFLELQCMLQFQIFVIYLSYTKQIIYKQTKFMLPSNYRSSALDLPILMDLLASSALLTTANTICYLFTSKIHPTSTENSGSLVYFYYCLIWFTLSFITFPNTRSWDDFCFVHLLKTQRKFPPRTARPDKYSQWRSAVSVSPVASHKIVYLKRRETPSLAATQFKTDFSLLMFLLIVKIVSIQALEGWSSQAFFW